MDGDVAEVRAEAGLHVLCARHREGLAGAAGYLVEAASRWIAACWRGAGDAVGWVPGFLPWCVRIMALTFPEVGAGVPRLYHFKTDHPVQRGIGRWT